MGADVNRASEAVVAADRLQHVGMNELVRRALAPDDDLLLDEGAAREVTVAFDEIMREGFRAVAGGT